MSKPEDIFAWMAKQKWPLGRRGVRKVSAAKLAELRRVGIKYVGYLGVNDPGQDCRSCVELLHRRIPINEARPLPLPGCDKKICKCVLFAVEPP